ncbi:hypothetical protein K7X08_031403 [Anisodus acutangulus]|uniref:Aminotransferase class I/classII large domain-containing protein n=1 Tax=Anisodus acutangulus TaxID=402998 RepID=A0A9Q1MLL1_9SOLA|nr:hypothetical protein K7X08_031403 [Anisodus acutangulus]
MQLDSTASDASHTEEAIEENVVGGAAKVLSGAIDSTTFVAAPDISDATAIISVSIPDLADGISDADEVFDECPQLVDSEILDGPSFLQYTTFGAYVDYAPNSKSLQPYFPMQASRVSLDGQVFPFFLQACCLKSLHSLQPVVYSNLIGSVFQWDVYVEVVLPRVIAHSQAPLLWRNLNVGLLFPTDVVERAKHCLVMTSGGLSAYGDSRGIPGVRTDIAELIKRHGYPSNQELIFLTNGASRGGMQILNTVIRSPPDKVFVPVPQSPLYTLYSVSISLFRSSLVLYYLGGTVNWGLDVTDLLQLVAQLIGCLQIASGVLLCGVLEFEKRRCIFSLTQRIAAYFNEAILSGLVGFGYGNIGQEIANLMQLCNSYRTLFGQLDATMDDVEAAVSDAIVLGKSLVVLGGSIDAKDFEARNLLEVTMPELPKPELPHLPEIPALPKPEFPEIPKPELPTLPKPILPEIPKVPELPTFPKPELPKLPQLEMPAIPKPELPTLPKSEIPQVPHKP